MGALSPMKVNISSIIFQVLPITPFQEYQNLVYDSLEVFIPNMKDPDARWIFPGKHFYEFRYKLSEKLPYSLDGSA